MKRHIVSAWVALVTVLFVLVGAQSAHAAVVSTVDYVLHSPSDWVTSTAVTPDGRYVFVTNYTNGSVSRFDTSTHAIQNVSVGSNPYGVAISPDGSTVAVACFGSNAVVFLNVNTLNTSLANGGSGPMGIAYSHDGTKVYVVDETDDTLREISATGHNTLNTVQITGSGWQASAYIAITSDDSKAYVTNIVGNSVTEIDLTTHTVTRTFTGFSGPRGLALTHDDSGLWVGNGDPSSNVLRLIDLTSGTVSRTVTIGYGALEMALSPDGSQLAVGQGQENFISLVDTQTFAVTQAPVGDPQASTGGNGKTGPWGVAYAPDGSTIYVGVEYNGKLAALTLDPALAPPSNNSGGSSSGSGSGSSSGTGSSASGLANTGAPALAGMWALGAALTVAGASFLIARRRRG